MAKLTDRGGIGNVYITPGASAALQKSGEDGLIYLSRHINMDWGELSEADVESNNKAVETGDRLLSAYTLKNGVKIWIITDAAVDGKREVTTILLPEEY